MPSEGETLSAIRVQHAPKPDVVDMAFERHLAPTLLLGPDGEILLSNQTAREALGLSVGAGGERRLRFGSLACNRRFNAAFASLGRVDGAARRLVLRTVDGEWCLVHLRWLESAKAALVVLCFDRPEQDVDVAPLAEAFSLTQSETQILSHLVQVRSPKEISRELEISAHTVRAHLRAIYAKLGVKGRSGALRLALKLIA